MRIAKQFSVTVLLRLMQDVLSWRRVLSLPVLYGLDWETGVAGEHTLYGRSEPASSDRQKPAQPFDLYSDCADNQNVSRYGFIRGFFLLIQAYLPRREILSGSHWGHCLLLRGQG